MEDLIGALGSLNVHATCVTGPDDRGEVRLTVDNEPLRIQIVAMGHPSAADIAHLPKPNHNSVVVIAMRLSEAARRELRLRGWRWLDFRGHLRFWTRSLLIETTVDPLVSPPSRFRRPANLFNPVGIEVAVELLLAPEEPASPRRLASVLGRSPGYLSVLLKEMKRQALIDDDGRPLAAELFWALADAWPREPVALAEAPPRLSTRRGRDIERYVLTDYVAAGEWGAPVIVGKGQTLDFYVPDEVTLRRASRQFGLATRVDLARATMRVAPSPAVFRHRSLRRTRWSLAHPLFVALDLAGTERGRETIREWVLPEDVEAARVW